MKKDFIKKPLHPSIEALFNEQIKKEDASSRQYLAMAMWCDIRGYKGAASLLYENAHEEKEHMLKLTAYLIERQVLPIIPAHERIQPQYTSFRALFEHVLQQEETITQAIHHIVHQALTHQDYATFDFLQWFVREQREEENQAHRVLELFDITGEDSIGLYTIDKAIGKLSKKETPIA